MPRFPYATAPSYTGGFDYSRFLSMKNQYQGRIFLLGSGPSLASLTAAQKKALAKEYTFGCSRLFRWTGLGFTPSFYVITEEMHTMNPQEFAPAQATIARFWTTWQPAPDETWVPLPRPPAHSHDVNHYGMFGLEMKCENGAEYGPHMHHGKDCPIAMAQIAHFLGFQKMYLLGCETTRGGHVYSAGDVRAARAEGVMRPFYERAASEVSLVDCTPGGTLAKERGGPLDYESLSKVLSRKGV